MLTFTPAKYLYMYMDNLENVEYRAIAIPPSKKYKLVAKYSLDYAQYK